MRNISKTTLRELKKRYLNILKKCFLANLMAFGMVTLATPATAGEDRLVNSGEKTYTQDVTFEDLEYSGNGGAIENDGTITFGGKAIFTNNSTSGKTSFGNHTEGGAIYNTGNITFSGKALFTNNAVNDGYYTYGGAVSNADVNSKMIFNGEAIFDNNKISSTTGYSRGVFYNEGEVIFKDTVSFINNKVDGKNAGFAAFVHENTSKAEFHKHVIFENNYSTSSSLNVAAAGVEGRGLISFTTADFMGNESFAPTAAATGSALHTVGADTKIIFSGLSRFINNSATGLKGIGGAVDIENGTVEFDEVQFINNMADTKGAGGRADGGALAVFGNAIFHKTAVFKENTAKTDGGNYSRGGAIYNSGTVTFENGFYFEGNKEIEVQTAEDGTVTETERLNDIYMRGGVINIEGSDANATEYLGGGVSGIEGAGTINKSSVATLVFGEESDSMGYTGIFNQSAGKTVARSETFLGGINNIDGGELETHGNEIKYTAIVGQNKDETTGEVLSSGTLTHFAMSETPVEIKGLSFKEGSEGVVMMFANGLESGTAHYVLNQNLAGEEKNQLTFADTKLSVPDTFEFKGAVLAKDVTLAGDGQQIKFKDLAVADDSMLDIKTNQVETQTLTLGNNATVGLTLKTATEKGSLETEQLLAGSGAKIALTVDEQFEGGLVELFDKDNPLNTLPVAENNVYNVVEVSEGKYSFMAKDTEALQESLGTTDNETVIANALTQGTTSHAVFSRMQSEMLVALQSQDAGTVAKAKKALNALGARSTSVYQSQATAQFTQMHTVITQMLMNSTAPIFGHAGGEEPARATVYVKGLYDRVNSLAGDGFRMRSKGAVLGVQSAITEDLTVGIGYAGINSIAKEPLRRTEVDTNTGFISAQYQPNNWWVNGVLTYSRSQYDEEKNILSTKGTANYDVDSFGAQITTGYNIKRGNWIVTPEVGVRYLNARQEGYMDSLGTIVEKTTSDFVTTMAGFKVGVDLGWMRPLAGVMVGYDVVTDDISAVNTLANKETYIIKGEALDRLSTTVVAGFAADLSDNATLKLEYSGNYRKEYLDHSGMGRLEWKF